MLQRQLLQHLFALLHAYTEDLLREASQLANHEERAAALEGHASAAASAVASAASAAAGGEAVATAGGGGSRVARLCHGGNGAATAHLCLGDVNGVGNSNAHGSASSVHLVCSAAEHVAVHIVSGSMIAISPK